MEPWSVLVFVEYGAETREKRIQLKKQNEWPAFRREARESGLRVERGVDKPNVQWDGAAGMRAENVL